MTNKITTLVLLVLVGSLAAATAAEEPATRNLKCFEDGRFWWKATGPLVSPDTAAADPETALKDPSIVRHQDRWHLFCTVRLASGKIDVEYANFADWSEADKAPRHVLKLHDQNYGAPQVFYFRPQRRWHLVFQMTDKDHHGPAYSTSTDLADPKSWSKPQWLFAEGIEAPRGLDFWVICDQAKAHLFYTTDDGRMWRSETRIADFPAGWSKPEVALQADIFEASHTYLLKGMNKYLTVIESLAPKRRYYKAYLADRLEGPWTGLADTFDKPFAAMSNVTQEKPWTTNISHGELLRIGTDEMMEVDPGNLRLLFQGTDDAGYLNKKYDKIPWRLGILESAGRPE